MLDGLCQNTAVRFPMIRTTRKSSRTQAPLMDAVKHEYLTIFLYGLPVLLIVGKLFFGSISGFLDCVRLALTPDVISLLRGEWGEDQWASVKVFVYLALCAGGMYSAHLHFYPA